MIWTAKDEETLRECRACLERCRHYHIHPAPWFELCLRMHGALEAAGLLAEGALERDYCHGCAFAAGDPPGCRQAYRSAVLDESRRRVVYCRQRTTQQQKAALERAAARKQGKRSASQAGKP